MASFRFAVIVFYSYLEVWKRWNEAILLSHCDSGVHFCVVQLWIGSQIEPGRGCDRKLERGPDGDRASDAIVFFWNEVLEGRGDDYRNGSCL